LKKISIKAAESENIVFEDKFNDVYAGMEKFEEFNEFCVQLMAHGRHISQYQNVYGFLNRRRYGLTIGGEITIDNLKTLKNTISKYIKEYNIKEWLNENKFEIMKK